MFKSKTLLIVGAGASSEYKLPLGVDFKSEIAGLTAFNHGQNEHISDDVKTYRQALNEYARIENIDRALLINASAVISNGLSSSISIDNFLHTHKSNQHIKICGKIAIALVIAKYERASSIVNNSKSDGSPNLAQIESKWINQFLQRLYEGVDLSELDTLFNNVAFVIFNYDRCFEWVVLNSIIAHFNLYDDESRAKSIVSNIRIYHPYGSLGSVFKTNEDECIALRFGENIDSQQLIEVARRIKTFTEHAEDNDLVNKIKDEVAGAQKLIFVGFGFNEQNMNLISIQNEGGVRDVFGTIYQFSEHDEFVIKSQIKQMMPFQPQINIKLINAKSSELFTKLSKSISA